jgi:hypothetical protein
MHKNKNIHTYIMVLLLFNYAIFYVARKLTALTLKVYTNIILRKLNLAHSQFYFNSCSETFRLKLSLGEEEYFLIVSLLPR